jgi:membrane glycosyltransferase
VAAPLWLLFLLVGILIALQAQFIRPEYFPKTFTLYPQWPAQDPIRAAWVFAGTMGLLLAPKLISYLAMLADPDARRGFGARRAFAGLVLEIVISGLIAPVMMLIQSASVVGILMGRDSGWNAQKRDDGTVPWRDAARRYGRHTLFGVALAVAAYGVSFSLFAWMTPVIVGLILAVPLAQWTASPAAGRVLRRIGLMVAPEEADEPEVLTRANALAAQFRSAAQAGALQRLAAEPELLAAHRALLPVPTSRRRGDVDVALAVGLAKLADCTSLTEAEAMLTRQEKMAVLSDARGVDRIVELESP